MTPPITKAIMASRPLYDPDPDTFVPQDVVQQRDLRRVRLSDFAVVALQLNIKNGHISKAAVDLFENVYVRGAKPRTTRVHEGRPALAPDGSVMSMNGDAYPGASQQPAGKWNIENVHDCPGYKDWLAKLTQTESEMEASGFPISSKNCPFPSKEDLDTANAYSPNSEPPKATSKKAKTEKASTKSDPIQVADDLINRTVGILDRFTAHVRSQVIDPLTQKALYGIMRGRIADVFPDEDSDGSSDESGEDDRENEDDGKGASKELTSGPTTPDTQCGPVAAPGAQRGRISEKSPPQQSAGEGDGRRTPAKRPKKTSWTPAKKQKKKSHRESDIEHQILEEEAGRTGEPIVYPDDFNDEDYIPTAA